MIKKEGIAWGIVATLVLIVTLLVTNSLSYNKGYDEAIENSQAEIHSIQLKIDNLERFQAWDTEDEVNIELELIEKIAEGLKSASGSFTVKSDGTTEVEVIFTYERKE